MPPDLPTEQTSGISSATSLDWKPDYRLELWRRYELLEKLNANPDLRKWAMQAYADDCVRWIEDWCITVDPRNSEEESGRPRKLPFLLFPRQKELVQFVLECIRDKEHGLVEKSRDMGATWLFCAISVWFWLFHPNTVIGWGSLLAHNIDDRGNPKAIFLKIRQLIDHLPAFMKPEGYDPRWHAPSMKILHPNLAFGTSIIGEGGDNMGRGGRTSWFVKDESAHYEHPDLIEASLGDNTDVQFDVSSVNGSANVFYRRRMAGQVWYPGRKIPKGTVRVFILDWRDHPFKTQAWHDDREERARREGLLHIFRQEVDRDYAGSIDRVIIPAEWVNAAVDAHKVLGIAEDGIHIAAQDIADEGADKNAFAGRWGIVLKCADDCGGDADSALDMGLPLALQFNIREIQYDSVGVGAGFKTAVNNRRKFGVFPKNIDVVPWNGGGEVLDPDKPVIPQDKQSPTNKDQYLNLKAQSWFRARTRFYKTWRMVKFGEQYPHDELISLDSTIPKLHELKMQLSQATHDANSKGKTIVDKKPDGTLSPNLADALVICYNPIKKPSGFFY